MGQMPPWLHWQLCRVAVVRAHLRDVRLAVLELLLQTVVLTLLQALRELRALFMALWLLTCTDLLKGIVLPKYTVRRKTAFLLKFTVPRKSHVLLKHIVLLKFLVNTVTLRLPKYVILKLFLVPLLLSVMYMILPKFIVLLLLLKMILVLWVAVAEEAQKILSKHPERIPVICERSARSTMPELPKNKFVVHGSMLCGEFKYIVHKQIADATPERLTVDQTIYLFVNGITPKTSTPMSQLYDQFKASDGFLYIRYGAENTLG
ncbi:ATG8 [Symbiodinium sp. CCMP2592]|nr:ATG8 [Symbiodinium sp. CCMP2592]